MKAWGSPEEEAATRGRDDTFKELDDAGIDLAPATPAELAAARAAAGSHDPHGGNEAETLSVVREILEQVESRLALHNRIEEGQIYPLAGGDLFRTADLEELSRTITAELENLPRRFAADRGTER